MPDSVFVNGTVVDHLTGAPQSSCTVHLLRGTDTAATALCDEEGDFATGLMPAGAYTLNVVLEGRHVYQMDLVLGDNASLNIAVITDTFSFRTLRPIEVTAFRNLLGPLQIVSKKDTRLWDFCYRGTPWEVPRDGNAAVAIPNTLHPLYGDDPYTEGGGCRGGVCNSSTSGGNKFYHQSYGLEVSPYNSAMKNELLREGRILDVKLPAQADTTSNCHEKR